MSAKHTPGPWDALSFGVFAQDVLVASVYGDDPDCRPDDRMWANARLIAAAPELLDALQWLVDLMPDPELDIDTVQREQVIKAKAAIAKATNPD